MISRIKHVIAGLVTRHWPTLFYYTVPRTARRGLRVYQRGKNLQIVDARRRRMIRISTANAVHLADMVGCFNYYFGSAEPVAFDCAGDVYELIDFSAPRVHKVVGFDDFPVLCPSTTEPFSTTRQYLDFAGLTPGSNVMDLGTYSGLTAIAFSKSVGAAGRVLAIEPDPINFRAAEQNIATHRRVNGLENVTLLPFAAADKDGVIELSSEGSMGSALISIVGDYRGESVRADSRTLMTLASEQGLDRVDFVKMDIEGAELGVVLASGEFLKKFRPKLVIEEHHVNGTSTARPLIEFLKKAGYQTRIRPQPGVTLGLIEAWPA